MYDWIQKWMYIYVSSSALCGREGGAKGQAAGTDRKEEEGVTSQTHRRVQ